MSCAKFENILKSKLSDCFPDQVNDNVQLGPDILENQPFRHHSLFATDELLKLILQINVKLNFVRLSYLLLTIFYIKHIIMTKLSLSQQITDKESYLIPTHLKTRYYIHCLVYMSQDTLKLGGS